MPKPKRIPFGDGLYKRTTATGVQSWIFRYTFNGKEHQMGLGAVRHRTKKEAKEKVREYRQMLTDKKDPMEARDAGQAASKLDDLRKTTFRQATTAYHAQQVGEWKNKKHLHDFMSSMQRYIFPSLGSLPVAAITTPLVVACLDPIWKTRTETASRVRGRIENVWDWAKFRGMCDGENPARWKGHLENALSRPNKITRVKHHAFLDYREIVHFMSSLSVRQSVVARALEFTILTAVRTGTTIAARWSEIDLNDGIWVVPAERMKVPREHRVPLSRRALSILSALPEPATRLTSNDRWLFPNMLAPSQHISDSAMSVMLKRMGHRGSFTVHGFRSTFRDWVAECTDFPAEVAEMALAHSIASKVEAAYRRGDLFEKRREMMEAWAQYCSA